METKKTNTQNKGNTESQSGMPDWVKHLLTSLGTMGVDFFFFIKPLQEKFDAQNTQLKDQEKRISELETRLNSFVTKPEKKQDLKSPYHQNERFEEKEPEEDLFTIKRKPPMTGRVQKSSYVKL